MKVYLVLVFLLNTAFDFLLLTTTSYLLKRNVKLKRIILGSVIGGLSIFLLFLKLNNFTLFIFKIVISIVMILSTFSFKNFKYFINNLIYLYLSSIVLGGGLYLINNEFNYKNYGILFVSNGFGLNIIVLIVLSPLILFFYIKQTRKLKLNYNNYYSTSLVYKNKTYKFTAYLDTGNKLKDQYKKRPIILIYTDKINFSYENGILVPYSTVNGNGILKCIVADKIIIDNEKIIDKPLIGLSSEKFNIEGINMILNNETLEGGK